jgi:hypothetical protein
MVLVDDRVVTSLPTKLRPPVISGHRRIPLGGRETPGGPRPGRRSRRQQAERICDGERPGSVAHAKLAEQPGLDVLDRLRSNP